MNELYDYFFHFNAYTGYWNAVNRNKANQYLNGTLGPEDTLKSKDINDLIRFLNKKKTTKQVNLNEE